MGWRIFGILISTITATTAAAYPTPFDVDGALHKWPISRDNPNVYYEVVSADSELQVYLQDIADESAAIWSSVDGSLLRLQPFDESNAARISIYYDNSITGGATAAGYSIFDSVDDGVPKHCSIHIAVNDGVDAEGLSKTTLHELGHCVGLGHSLMPESIMSYSLDRNSYALSADDRAAMARIYPESGGHARLAPGCSIGVLRHGPAYSWRLYALFIGIPAIYRFLALILRKFVRI
jgi:hypothetical protein